MTSALGSFREDWRAFPLSGITEEAGSFEPVGFPWKIGHAAKGRWIEHFVRRFFGFVRQWVPHPGLTRHEFADDFYDFANECYPITRHSSRWIQTFSSWDSWMAGRMFGYHIPRPATSRPFIVISIVTNDWTVT